MKALLILFLPLITCCVSSKPIAQYQGYNMVWSEEFDGSTIDTSLFNFELGDGCPNLCGWGNKELQHYTSDPKNVRQESGYLILTATNPKKDIYRSARLTTQGKRSFRYGRVDIRAKLPLGQGIWPALWMLGDNIKDLGWPACGEIDIMEMVGQKPNQISAAAHWGKQWNPSIHISGTYDNPLPFAEEFHVFSVEWTSESLKWFVDDQLFHTIGADQVHMDPNPFDGTFFFILNIAVGGNHPGSPDASTPFPQAMKVDYIRVYQKHSS